MTYRIIVISKDQLHLNVQVENLNRDNLDAFIEEFNTGGLRLTLNLVDINLEIADCHRLGLFLKTLALQDLNLKDSKLSIEASVALYSHLSTKENLINYCFNSAKTYYQKGTEFYIHGHPYGPLYLNHAQAFKAAGNKIAGTALIDHNPQIDNAALIERANRGLKSP